MKASPLTQTPIPTRWVGPVLIKGDLINSEHIELPLATFETPMWPSVNRGARVCTQSGGLNITLISEQMTRSIVFRAEDAAIALKAWQDIAQNFSTLAKHAEKTSQFVKLLDLRPQFLGNLLYIRCAYTCGDASGHNMTTLASDAIQKQILEDHPELNYASISANICVDKKVSAINGILGRGKEVVAECVIPEKYLNSYLHTTAEKMMALHIHKNLNGSLLAGSIRSANAHFANMLLAFYLATGQDGANIVEGSQGFTHMEIRGKDLYFSVNIPHLIVGTVGNGKNDSVMAENLQRLGCKNDRPTGENAQRLAIIAAATVACGELSLLAAQTNVGELINAHLQIERPS